MRDVRITGVVRGGDPDDVFAIVTDLERFPGLCSDVREVRTTETDGTHRSTWKVKFRGGVLEWTEQDDTDAVTRTMEFRQLEGDFKEFQGRWHVEPRGSDNVVEFDASFDLGIPGLRAVIEPIAAKSLRANLCAVLRGLFGPEIELDGSAG